MDKEDNEFYVTKANGDVVPFQKHKLIRSLMASGASEQEADQVWESIMANMYEGITTKKIFRLAFQMLKKSRKGIAAKYKLKNAIRELGPAGYNFEKFVAEIFVRMEYHVENNLFLMGKCVQHEVDIEFTKGDEQHWAECKFFNSQGSKVDVKIALYSYARYLDLKAGYVKENGDSKTFNCWIFTNNRFTKDAMDYASCMQINAISWDYPQKNSLKSLVEKSGLYPVTCLTTLTQKEKQTLLQQHIVFCRQINSETLLEPLKLSENRKAKVMDEIKWLKGGE